MKYIWFGVLYIMECYTQRDTKLKKAVKGRKEKFMLTVGGIHIIAAVSECKHTKWCLSSL